MSEDTDVKQEMEEQVKIKNPDRVKGGLKAQANRKIRKELEKESELRSVQAQLNSVQAEPSSVQAESSYVSNTNLFLVGLLIISGIYIYKNKNKKVSEEPSSHKGF